MDVSQQLIDALYVPSLKPDQLDLNQVVEQVQEPAAEQKVLETLIQDTSGRPLTEEEAKVVDAQITRQRQRIVEIQKKIKSLHNVLDKEGDVVEFAFDVKARGSLKRAIQKVFGVKTDKITYAMYTEALQAKHLLELTDSQEYLDGEPAKTKSE